VRHFLTAQRAALPAVAAAFGALIATPAFADVTVSPTTAVQGSGENLYFTVTNDGKLPLNTVKLEWPADTPVAEVYPLSVDDWAPRIDMQKLSKPLNQIHGGTPVSEVAKSITWFAMPGRALAPGKSTELAVAIGPLPTLSSMSFKVVTTYPDGKPGPTMPTTLTLTPAANGQPAPGHGQSGTGGTAAEDQIFADTVADATRGPSIWSIGGWVVAGLALLGGLIYFLRGRHRAEEDDEPDDEDPKPKKAEAKQTDAAEQTKEPVTAGNKWSFRG
jgi:hypothetical protein